MNIERKQLWLDALESDLYEQTTGGLRRGDKFCCLGVACDIFSKAPGVEWEPLHESTDERTKTILGLSGSLPNEVAEWFGLDDDDPVVSPSPGSSEPTTLRGCNDYLKYNFKEISNLIREQL